MQPGEANKFSTHNKTGDGSQVPGVGKNVAVPSQAPNESSPALLPLPPAAEARQPAPGTRHLTPDSVGYLMVLPYLLHLVIFLGYPLAFAFVLIFHRWNIYTPMKWVGLGNIKLLLSDPLVWRALFNTLYFLVIHIPLQLVIALGLAQLLNQKIRGRAFFRASYFLPFVISGVVVTILWQQLYAVETGIINVSLQLIGLPKIGWLTDHRFAMPAIAIMATWKNVGLYIVLFLVGLQSIPSHLYEAAELDGASGWQQFRLITVPMLNPTIMLVLVLSTIGGFSLFIEPYVMTGGGPANSTLSGILYLYKQAFFFSKMGYATTIGFFWATIIFIVVLFQRRFVETEAM
ncbi:MAG: sugar ABC transporter permease [Acidobacteriota bacterium]|nr:sugar ABC transporter permease [Acidobacteriota bacterium]